MKTRRLHIATYTCDSGKSVSASGYTMDEAINVLGEFVEETFPPEDPYATVPATQIVIDD